MQDDTIFQARHGWEALWPETSRRRLIIVGTLFFVAFLAIGLRLIDVSLFRVREPRLARRPASNEVALGRADIVDRNGVLLATTLRVPSLYANPRQILNPRATAKALVALLPDLDEEEVLAKLTSSASFVWLKRFLTPRQKLDVNRLGNPGLQFVLEDRRVYPNGNLTTHVVGYTSIDGKGLAGVERGLDETLRGEHDPVQLSIDVRLQWILREEIARQIVDFTAAAGMGIVMDVRNGEILAMVSLPDFDPGDPGAAAPQELFNRVTLGIYEMGSVFKTFSTAMALDAHTATLASSYDVTDPIHIGGFTIHDFEPMRGRLTVPEIFMHSSNIGEAKLTLEAGTARQKEFLARLGLLGPPTLEMREIGKPLFPSRWATINTMTIAYGQGISVSALQMATAASAIVNGGILYPPTLRKYPKGYAPTGQPVVSAETSEEMRKLMRLVVEKGTGKFAEAKGYIVGGKTGTAEKVVGRGYAKKSLLSSFIGAFPMNDPRYLVFVVIDEPHPNRASHGFATGGWVAAPAVSRVVQRMAPMLGIQPVDENAPEIRRALGIDIGALKAQELASR